MNNLAISVLDLSQSGEVDISAAADELVKATAHCGFIYVNINSHNANIIKNVRRTQRAFFTLSLDEKQKIAIDCNNRGYLCLLYTSPSPRDQRGSRMPSSA